MYAAGRVIDKRCGQPSRLDDSTCERKPDWNDAGHSDAGSAGQLKYQFGPEVAGLASSDRAKSDCAYDDLIRSPDKALKRTTT